MRQILLAHYFLLTSKGYWPVVTAMAARQEFLTVEIRWDEKAGLRTGCGVRSQVIDVLEAQEIKETGNEEG
jgi:hypothetical protein